MNPLYTVAAMATVFAVLFLFGLLQAAAGPEAALRKHALQLGRWGKAEGQARLQERVNELRLRFPGKSEAWLLQWIVDDLKRAKR